MTPDIGQTQLRLSLLSRESRAAVLPSPLVLLDKGIGNALSPQNQQGPRVVFQTIPNSQFLMPPTLETLSSRSHYSSSFVPLPFVQHICSTANEQCPTRNYQQATTVPTSNLTPKGRERPPISWNFAHPPSSSHSSCRMPPRWWRLASGSVC